jgi:hypothetical protein
MGRKKWESRLSAAYEENVFTFASTDGIDGNDRTADRTPIGSHRL